MGKMGKLQSLDMETLSHATPRNPYGSRNPSVNQGSSQWGNAKLYLLIFLIVFAIYGATRMIFPPLKSNSSDRWTAEYVHNQHVEDRGDSPQVTSNLMSDSFTASLPSSLINNDVKTTSYDSERLEKELRESEFVSALSPLIILPSHARPEYEKYQSHDDDYSDTAEVDVLYDKSTAHGMAFNFLLNRDKRTIKSDDPHLVQRFVLALIFYAMGGKDENNPEEYTKDESRGVWKSDRAHFLTRLHECHWVRKGIQDQFWDMLYIDKESDRRLGVTKCNHDMEVTKIRLADLNLIGFIPEEIKWLKSLESLDIQNNHLAGHIPQSLGEMEQLRYLSLDGNNFSGTVPDVFYNLKSLEKAYFHFNDFNGPMPPSLCTLRNEGALNHLWSDCGGYPITCTCCTVCCDMVADCDEMGSQKRG